ncbi:MAG: MBL fold metallo-hydrolase [Candidatus Bathyarchaeia archaeon]|jgi:glyoxylase-like metal-dependent hydrolase (beta-lactamase superfamily II)
MFFKQIKYRGDNFTYIIADEASGEVAVIDPSFNVDAVILILKDQSFNLKYIINTHGHTDHTAGNEELKSVFHSKIIAHKLSHVNQDISVVDGDTIRLGTVTIKVIHTPGHTPDSICLLTDGKLLTGDTLFVGECGRTDLPGGSAKDLYTSLLQKIAKLDDNLEVYPGHDYGPFPNSTIAKEKQTNYTLQNRTLQQFIQFMQQP